MKEKEPKSTVETRLAAIEQIYTQETEKAALGYVQPVVIASVAGGAMLTIVSTTLEYSGDDKTTRILLYIFPALFPLIVLIWRQLSGPARSKQEGTLIGIFCIFILGVACGVLGTRSQRMNLHSKFLLSIGVTLVLLMIYFYTLSQRKELLIFSIVGLALMVAGALSPGKNIK